MIILRLGKKRLITALIIVLAFSVGFNVLSFVYISDLLKDYNSLVYAVNLWDESDVAAFITSDNTGILGRKDIEIFDIEKGMVIKRLNPDSQTRARIQNEVRNYLKNITGMFVKVNAFPDSGYIVRLPLDPAEEIHNQWLNQSVNEVFVIFSKEPPYLLVLDEKERPLFYNFDGSTDELLELLGFNPEENEGEQ